ncbi:MAG: lipase [Methylobacter sp.]|nr:MAG: lipase [Methylobacter sp.]PPD04060.1 MAG: lipase [Methylobacter sp.]PPD23333.1 MAG: lipase [Methylobacter sp.]PPD34900.1 MAG: lipase [Methylomonas sp.]
MNEEINENLKKLSTWKRIFFMLIFAAIGGLVRMLIWAVILLQVASTLLTGQVNANILVFGRNLARYTFHILLFLTYNTDTLPFPFADWQASIDLELPDHKTGQP